MKRQTIQNGLWGSLPPLAFFLSFPAVIHILDQRMLDRVLGFLPVIAVLSNFDFGIGRTLLRLTGRANGATRRMSEAVLDSATGSVLVYGYSVVAVGFGGVAALYFTNMLDWPPSAIWIIVGSAPLMIVSTVLSSFFDGQARFDVQNRRVNPLLALQWPLILAVASLWPEETILVVSMVAPKLMALLVQWQALGHRARLRVTGLPRLWRNAPWRANCLTSFMSPLCSNLDRLMVALLASAGAGTYVALSEVSRRSSGLAKPLVRVISAGRHLGPTSSTRRDTDWLASASSGASLLITLAFGAYLLNGNDLTLGTLRSQPIDNLVMLVVFAAAAAMQVQSLVRFMTTTLAGRALAIARYQMIQVALGTLLFAWLASNQALAICAVAYLGLRTADYLFLRRLDRGPSQNGAT